MFDPCIPFQLIFYICEQHYILSLSKAPPVNIRLAYEDFQSTNTLAYLSWTSEKKKNIHKGGITANCHKTLFSHILQTSEMS